MPVDVAARILSQKALPADHFLLTLDAPAIARAARPGQFVMLQVHDGRDPLLRRPMSVCRIPGPERRRANEAPRTWRGPLPRRAPYSPRSPSSAPGGSPVRSSVSCGAARPTSSPFGLPPRRRA